MHLWSVKSTLELQKCLGTIVLFWHALLYWKNENKSFGFDWSGINKNDCRNSFVWHMSMSVISLWKLFRISICWQSSYQVVKRNYISIKRLDQNHLRIFWTCSDKRQELIQELMQILTSRKFSTSWPWVKNFFCNCSHEIDLQYNQSCTNSHFIPRNQLTVFFLKPGSFRERNQACLKTDNN